MGSIRALVALLSLSILIAACGGSGGGPTATSQPAVRPTASQTAAAATPSSVALATATLALEPTGTATEPPKATATEPPTATTAPTAVPSPIATPTAAIDPVVYNDIVVGDLTIGPDGTSHGPTAPLYTIDADGSDLRPVTNPPDGGYDSLPVISPDGTRVAFVRSVRDQDYQAIAGGVYVADITTGEEHFIVDGRAQVSWSPDGRQLLMHWQEHAYHGFCCGGAEDLGYFGKIAVVDADGSNLQVLLEPTFVDANDYTGAQGASWSPDGSRILMSRRTRQPDRDTVTTLVVMNADGSAVHDIDTGQVSPQYWKSWTPDGESVLFAGAEGDGPTGLYVVTPDGGGLTRLTPSDLEVVEWIFPTVRDDGSITFVGTDPIRLNEPQPLYRIAADGSGLTRLTAPESRVSEYSYSPDSSAIAVGGDGFGTPLAVLDANGATIATLDVPQKCWGEPAWSPESTRLAYLACGDGVNELRVIDVRTGAVTPALARVRSGEGVIQPVWRLTGE